MRGVALALCLVGCLSHEMQPTTADRYKTVGVLGGVAAVLIAWDVYLARTQPVGGTISGQIKEFGRDHMIVPVLFGVLMGHVFWSQKIK